MVQTNTIQRSTSPAYFLVCLSLLLWNNNLIGQQKDTIPKHPQSELVYYHFDDYRTIYQLDSTITNFHHYDPVTFHNPPHIRLSNTGAPHHRLVYEPLHVDNGLNWTPYDLYQFKTEDVSLYNPPFPYTRMYYVQGLGDEQLFRANHSQNLKDRLNFGGEYRVIGSGGFYDRQRTNLDNLLLFTRYANKRRNYSVIASYILNDVKNEINGGLDIDSPADLAIIPRNLLNTRLDDAQVHFSNKTFTLKQTFAAGPAKTDSINDSTSITYIVPRWQLSHRFQFLNEYYLFTDGVPTSDYYDEILLTPDSTYDHSQIWVPENIISLSFLGGKLADSSSAFSIRGYAGHQYTVLNQQGRVLRYHNIPLGFNASLHLVKTIPISVRTNGEFIIAGYHFGDYKWQGKADFSGGDWRNISARISTTRMSTPELFNNYLSNHHYWDQQLEPVFISQVGGTFKIPVAESSINLDYFTVDNQYYFDSLIIPKNDTSTRSIFRLRANLNYGLGKFHTTHDIYFQTVSGGPIHLPTYVGRHNVYFEDKIFKKALQIQLGIEVNTHSTYFADEFDAATGQFFTQDVVRVQRYPVIDLFINARIKTARFFFMIENLNQGVNFPQAYFVTPTYPGIDRNFRFGIEWRFFN